MGIGSHSVEFIRQFFRKSEFDRPPFVPITAYGNISNSAPYFSYGMAGGSLQGVTDYLRIDTDLVARFMDAEDQDDNPLISSALDIYSDDSCQVDSQNGKSIWIECADEEIRSQLDNLLHKTINIEETIWATIRVLCKYGNCYQEIVAKQGKGVVALNPLPPPSVRRIEVPKEIGRDPRAEEDEEVHWDTLGFLYDPRGLFKVTTKQFIDELKYKVTGEAPTSERMMGCAVFEGWEVVHMRLLGKNPYSFYGFGVGEPARWIFKRLLLLEDSIILHRLCLRGDTNIWTTTGYKKIRDLNEGDEVYSYGKDLKLHKTKVIYKKYNGVDKIYKLSSKHRELYANETHPVLVEIEHHQGSGKPILKGLEYVEVKSIVPGKHKFVTPEVLDDHAEDVRLEIPIVQKKARIKPSHVIPVRPKGLFQVGRDQGVEYGRLRKFLRGEKWLPEDTAKRVCSTLNISYEGLEIIEDWGNLRQVNIPEIVNEDFARLFGFMLGDGFLGAKKHKNGYIAKNNVGLALGDDEEMNEKYINLFKSFFGEGYLGYKGERKNSYSVNSKDLYSFFEMNGYISGAENKRVPSWIYRCSKSIRMALIEGLVDADGHRKQNRSEGLRDRFQSQSIALELCNRPLLEDFRELCMQCGLSVGSKVNSRDREGGHILEGRVMPAVTSHTLHFSFADYNQEREIETVDLVEDDDIWDIGVESDEHNFVANGVVVHNTRAPSRYAFYVDVSGVPPNETNAYLTRVKQGLKKSKFVNPNSGKMDQKYNVLSSDEDFFLGVRDGKESTRVETLQGPIYDHIEDVKFFEDKLFAALKVPKPFLTYEESTAKTHLSAEDARFARTILRIQREIRHGLKKVCKVHLAVLGLNPETIEFDVCMTMPSAIFELSQLEIRAAELDLASKYEGWANKNWIKSHVLGWSDDHIREAWVEGDQDKQPGGGGGDLDKALAKRGSPKAPKEKAISEPEGATKVFATDAETVGSQVASKQISNPDILLSAVKKNTEKLLERIDHLRSQAPNKTSDIKLNEISKALKEMRHSMDRDRK